MKALKSRGYLAREDTVSENKAASHKVLAWLLALLLAIGMMPVTGLAYAGVASDGDQEDVVSRSELLPGDPAEGLDVDGPRDHGYELGDDRVDSTQGLAFSPIYSASIASDGLEPAADDPEDEDIPGTDAVITKLDVSWFLPEGLDDSYFLLSTSDDDKHDLSIFSAKSYSLSSTLPTVSFYPMLDMEFSGTYAIGANEIEITVPAHIFKDAYGGYADQLRWPEAIPSWEVLKDMDDAERAAYDSPFCYQLDDSGEFYKLTNWKNIPGGGYSPKIQLEYRIDDIVTAMDHVRNVKPTSGSATDLNAYRGNSSIFLDAFESTDYEGHSLPFQASAIFTKGDSAKTTRESNIIYGQVDTWVSVDETTKTHMYGTTETIFYDWDSRWGGKPQTDPDEKYLYIVWALGTRVSSASQEYLINYVDPVENVTVEHEDGSKSEAEVELIGYWSGGTSTDSPHTKTYTDADGNPLVPSLWDDVDGMQVPTSGNGTGETGSFTTYNNRRYPEGMLVRIKRSELQDGDVITNISESIGQGLQNGCATTLSATDSLTYFSPDDDFKAPPGWFHLEKTTSGSDKGGINFLENDKSLLVDTAHFANSGTYRGSHLTLEPGDDPFDPESYGKRAYEVELADDMFFLRGQNGSRGSSGQSVPVSEYTDYDEDARLLADDYYLPHIEFSHALYDFSYDPVKASWTYERCSTDIFNNGENKLDIYVKISNGESVSVDSLEWTKIGSLGYERYAYRFTPEPGFEGISSEIKTAQNNVLLEFGELRVVGAMARVTTTHGQAKIDIKVGDYSGYRKFMVLNPTDHVKSLLAKIDDAATIDDYYNYGRIVDVDTLIVRDDQGAEQDLTDLFDNTAPNVKMPYSYLAYQYVNDRDVQKGLIRNEGDSQRCYAAHAGQSFDLTKLSGGGSGLTKVLADHTDTADQRIRLDYRMSGYETQETPSFPYGQNTKQVACDFLEEAGLLKPQYEGTFYDLLPLDVYPDLDSVDVKGRVEGYRQHTEDCYQSTPDSIEAEAHPDWKGTGRTMLIVKATFSNRDDVCGYYTNVNRMYSGMQLTFSAYIGFSEYVMRETNQFTNYVAYKTGNDSLNAGQTDSGSFYLNNASSASVPEDIANAYFDMDGDHATDQKRFLYGRAQDNVIDIVAMAFGLTKNVKGMNTSRFSKGQFDSVWTRPGGSYDYQLKLTSREGSDTRDIVFYDQLESYEPLSLEEGYGEPSWKGVLEGVDTSDAEALGIAPTIYYSTKTDLDLDSIQDKDLMNNTIWLESSEFLSKGYDLSDVKAVAVDVSKTVDGDDFILKEKQSLAVNLKMRAPSGEDAIELVKQRAHAYNNVYATAQVSYSDQDDWSSNSTVHENYTQILLYEEYTDIAIEKSWDDEDDAHGMRPDDIEVTLRANGDVVDIVTLDEDNGWRYLFSDLPMNDEAGDPIRYTVDEADVLGYESTVSGPIESIVDGVRTNTFSIENEYVVNETDLSVEKTWIDSDDPDRPASISVQLCMDGVPYGDAVILDDSNDWSYEWTGLNAYHEWTVSESNIPSGYEASYSEEDGNWTITNTKTDERIAGSLSLRKIVDLEDVSTERAQEATKAKNDLVYTFEVTGPEQVNGVYGIRGGGTVRFVDGVGMVRITGEGEVVIEGLPFGDYSVKEIRDDVALPGFILTVDDKGTTSIDEKANGELSVTNRYVDPEGSLTVKKVVEGLDPTGKLFSFTIAAQGDTVDAVKGSTIALDNGESLTFDEEGTADLTIPGQGSVTLTGLPSGDYLVSEDIDGSKVDGYILAVKIDDGGSVTIGDQSVEVVVTNSYSKPDAGDGKIESKDDPTGGFASTGDGASLLTLGVLSVLALISLASIGARRRLWD